MTSTSPSDTHALSELPVSFLPNPRHVSFSNETKTATRDPRKIVIAYEQTKYSDAFLDRSIRTGLIEPDDHIYLVHISQQGVLESILTYSAALGVLPSSDTDLQRRDIQNKEEIMHDIKEDMLNAVSEVLRKHSFKHIRTEVIEGDPKLSLVDYCVSVKPTFLVMGSRGLGIIKSSILGSVSEYLAHHCPCPVMIIKVTDADVEARKEQNEAAHSTFQARRAKFGVHI